jgi:hypothetical protein
VRQPITGLSYIANLEERIQNISGIHEEEAVGVANVLPTVSLL